MIQGSGAIGMLIDKMRRWPSIHSGGSKLSLPLAVPAAWPEARKSPGASGVVGAITPFNFPFMLNVVKSAPALAAGCTVVLKPRSVDPARRDDAGPSDTGGGSAARSVQRRRWVTPMSARRWSPAR